MKIELPIPDSIAKELGEVAALEEMSIPEFILSEILLHIRGCFIICDKCGKVLADERKLPTGMGSTYTITCECGAVMEFEDEE